MNVKTIRGASVSQRLVASAVVVAALMATVTAAGPDRRLLLTAEWWATTAGVPPALLLAAAALAQHRPASGAARAVARGGTQMLLQLTPVVLLSIVFPLISPRVAHVRVAGVAFSTLLLATSLTVPWLSQAVCLPLYRALGPLVAGPDAATAVPSRFLRLWLPTLLLTAPVAVLFAIPVELALHWSAPAVGAYLLVCLLHVAFAQSLVPVNLLRRRRAWAIAWTGYALALLVVPTLWYLPPLVGLLLQVRWTRAHARRVLQPVFLDVAATASEVLHGLLLGAVLWADKYLWFLVSQGWTRGDFAVSAVFLGMLPSILAYNYYFVRLAPTVDATVLDLREAMTGALRADMRHHSVRVGHVVEASLLRAALVGTLLMYVLAQVLARWASISLPLVGAVGFASLLFSLMTLLCYKLDYFGDTRRAAAYSGLHLLVCVVAFSLLGPGPLLYAWLSIADIAIITFALSSCLKQWRSAEFTLFWRQAVAW